MPSPSVNLGSHRVQLMSQGVRRCLLPSSLLSLRLHLAVACDGRPNNADQTQQADGEGDEGHRVPPRPLADADEDIRVACPGRPALGGPAQVVGQFAGAGVAAARLFVQTAADDRFHVGRHRAFADRRDRQRVNRLDLLQRRARRAGLEWRLAGQALVQDCPQRVDVRRRADLLRPAPRLLRCEIAGEPVLQVLVGHVALYQPRLRQTVAGDLGNAQRRVNAARRGLGCLRLLLVGTLHVKENRVRAQSAVDNAFLMGEVDGAG